MAPHNPRIQTSAFPEQGGAGWSLEAFCWVSLLDSASGRFWRGGLGALPRATDARSEQLYDLGRFRGSN